MLQQKMKEILQKEDDLQEIVQSLAGNQISKLDAFLITEICQMQTENQTKSKGCTPFSKCHWLREEACFATSLRLVGKDSLSEDQKCTLEVAKIIREAGVLLSEVATVSQSRLQTFRTSCSRMDSPSMTSCVRWPRPLV